MTAKVGGLWDALLGEGRRFWIVATSDSHVNYADASRPGSDFWPGQYQKTYVLAYKTYDDVLDGLRQGRVFAVAGDLVSELSVTAAGDGAQAEMGGTLRVQASTAVTVTIRFTDPETRNAHGDNPAMKRVDLIVGDVRGPATDRASDTNDSAKVVSRFTAAEWKKNEDVVTVTTTLPALKSDVYLRVRGTNTGELEPSMDGAGEDPWSDLWVYSNPIFVEVK